MYITHVPDFRMQPDFSYSFETWGCLDRARGVETNALKCDDMKGYLPMQPNHFHCWSQGNLSVVGRWGENVASYTEFSDKRGEKLRVGRIYQNSRKKQDKIAGGGGRKSLLSRVMIMCLLSSPCCAMKLLYHHNFIMFVTALHYIPGPRERENLSTPHYILFISLI